MIKAPHRRLLSALAVVTAFWMSVGTVYYLFHHSVTDDGRLFSNLILNSLGRGVWIIVFLAASAGLALLIRASEIFTISVGLRPEEYRGAGTTIGILPRPILPDGSENAGPDLKVLNTIFAEWKKDPRLDPDNALKEMMEKWEKDQNPDPKALYKAIRDWGRDTRLDSNALKKIMWKLENDTRLDPKALKEIMGKWGKDMRLNIQAVMDIAAAYTPESALFWSVFHILQAADLPASPRPGEHGGAGLLDHSLRVCAGLAGVWRRRQKDALEASKERMESLPVVVDRPLESAPYPLSIAVLTGIAHDIGKVACFRRNDDGEIVVVGLHDMVGSRILGKLPALWGLRDEQGNPDTFAQHLLTQSIRYYHHPSAFPMSGFKRDLLSPDPAIKQLMADIRQADLVAGGIEGREGEIAHDYLEDEDLEAMGFDEQIWDAFLFLLEDESRVNSPSPARRLAYKRGPLLYLIEPKIRERICDHLSINRVDYAVPNNGNPGKIIQIIASRLDSMGLLIKDFKKWSSNKPEGAAARIQFEGQGKDGESRTAEEKIPHYLMKLGPESPFTGLLALEDYPASITVKGLFWPQFGPKGKSEKESEAEKLTGMPIENDRPDDTQTPEATETPPPAETRESVVEPAKAETSTASEHTADEQGGDEEAPDDDDDDGDPLNVGAAPAPESKPLPAAGAPDDRRQRAVEAPEAARADLADQDAPPEASPSTEPPEAAAAGRAGRRPEATNSADREERRARLEKVRNASNHPKERLAKREMYSGLARTDRVIARTTEQLAHHKNCLEKIDDITLDETEQMQLMTALVWMEELRKDRIATLTITRDPNAMLRILLSVFLSFPLSSSFERMAYGAFTMLIRKSGISAGEVLSVFVPEIHIMFSLRAIYENNEITFDPMQSTLTLPINAPEDQPAQVVDHL